MPLLVSRTETDAGVGADEVRSSVTYLYVPGHARVFIRMLVAKIAVAAIICAALVLAMGHRFGVIDAAVVFAMVVAMLAIAETTRLVKQRHTVVERKRAPMSDDASNESRTPAPMSPEKLLTNSATPMPSITTPSSIANCHLTIEERMRSYMGETITVATPTIAQADAMAEATAKATQAAIRPSSATLH